MFANDDDEERDGDREEERGTRKKRKRTAPETEGAVLLQNVVERMKPVDEKRRENVSGIIIISFYLSVSPLFEFSPCSSLSPHVLPVTDVPAMSHRRVKTFSSLSLPSFAPRIAAFAPECLHDVTFALSLHHHDHMPLQHFPNSIPICNCFPLTCSFFNLHSHVLTFTSRTRGERPNWIER